ncbi:hypothetical protein SAMN05444355_103263 [Flavobacterium frigoris]|uniref:Uncharacterized protein n=1 Tax=Flavobacterium frigoris TaxID=229204 RepID=A0A1H9HUU5_FLAFI|nr:hypothetical protein SAMN05444355_103263 [Flavobacterium frigoris]
MEWYEIVIGILIWIVGVFIYMKYKDFQKNKYHNDSFKKKYK